MSKKRSSPCVSRNANTLSIASDQCCTLSRPRYARSMSSLNWRATSAYRSATDTITSVGSRCVMTNRASGNARSKWSSHNRCDGHFRRHGFVGARHCNSFNTRRSYAVGRREVGIEQPLGIRRDVRERLEVVRLEIEGHEVLALLGPGRRRRHQRTKTRRELLLHLVFGLGRGDAWIRAFDRRRRRARPRRLPANQRPRVRVLGEQERERARSRARQAEPDQRRVDRLVVDLGMTAVPVLDLQTLREQVAEHEPAAQAHRAD